MQQGTGKNSMDARIADVFVSGSIDSVLFCSRLVLGGMFVVFLVVVLLQELKSY